MDLRPGERLDDLGRSGLKIIQHPGRFPFAMDPVLLAHWTRVRPADRILDLGTGSGVIPLLLAARHPTVQISGLELQADVAEMADRSVNLNRLRERIEIRCGDYRDIPELYGHGMFDVVTMNPPYREAGRGAISPEAARATARHELAGGLSEAAAAAAAAVKYGGRVTVVFLAERLTDLVVSLRAHRLEPKRLRFVHPRVGRVANLLLLEAVKGGGAGMHVEVPLIVYKQGQHYTDEMSRIYDG